ncbi:MAG TPA: hypothetical protein VFV97_12755, partial [Rhodanobacteraceae bacterium]|nr:hypothetical protein [Rhodanobacteraceae bacterium]
MLDEAACDCGCVASCVSAFAASGGGVRLRPGERTTSTITACTSARGDSAVRGRSAGACVGGGDGGAGDTISASVWLGTGAPTGAGICFAGDAAVSVPTGNRARVMRGGSTVGGTGVSATRPLCAISACATGCGITNAAFATILCDAGAGVACICVESSLVFSRAGTGRGPAAWAVVATICELADDGTVRGSTPFASGAMNGIDAANGNACGAALSSSCSPS